LFIFNPMKKTKSTTIQVTGSNQRSALASPLRLEILGLFTNPEPLAIADMARMMGRTPGSLYHHVGLLEKAELLKRTGTRPKGKRHEALFRPTATRIEIDASSGTEEVVGHVVKALSSAFRMAERDLAAALVSGASRTDGPGRNLFATRMHMRASPKLLAQLNKHLKAIEDLMVADAEKSTQPSPDDEHLSLTIALLPIKGRGRTEKKKGQ
jgi:predicted transcriptional regulator